MKNGIIKNAKTLIIAGIAALTAGTASAASITTTFASNNGYAGNMFDVTTFGNDLNLTGLDINTEVTAGQNVTVSLYTRVGSYSGHEYDASAWNLLDSMTFASAGKDNASFFDLTDSVLAKNTTYGFYVDLTSYSGSSGSLQYTNGNNTYSNSDLKIDTGIGRGNGAFTGSVFNNRTWNGTVHYNVAKVPDTASTFALFGFVIAAFVGVKRKIRK